MIACTFLLGLVRDGNDANTTLFTSLQKTMGDKSSQEIADIVKKLEARGGREQLLLFLTGPAGSGKSTAMRVAEQFCYEFCMAVGGMVQANVGQKRLKRNILRRFFYRPLLG